MERVELMDRDEALKLLGGGDQGIAEWNRRRETGEVIPDLWDVALCRAALGGVDLRRADVRRADLSGAILDRANLIDANLSKAQLAGAFLRGANLSGANLFEANLSGAILIDADLSVTSFDGTIFGKADLTGATCWHTTFADVDLTEVKGLDSLKHSASSTVGIDTLIHSRGRIPAAFLRGCGVPDVLVSNLPNLISTMSPIQYYSCFISYSSENKDFAERLYSDLEAKGVRCYFDQDDLKIGDKIRPGIIEAIRTHEKLMLVLTEHSIASVWVEGEVEAALERERKEKRTVLFPIRLDDAVLETQIAWASHIRQTRQIGDFRGWENHGTYQIAFARLIRNLQAAEASK
jgi:hypothetical protein